MKRTTISLAPSLLKAVKELARQEGRAMGKVMSSLMEIGLKTTAVRVPKRAKKIDWHSQSMKAKIDYNDSDELYKKLDTDPRK